MDLTNQPVIKTLYELNEETNLLTINITDENDNPIDSIVIENIKYEAFLKALYFIAQERSRSLDVKSLARTEYNSVTELGIIEFV